MKKQYLKHAEKSSILASSIALLIIILILFCNTLCRGQTIEQLQQEVDILKQQIEVEKNNLEPILDMADQAKDHAKKFTLYNDKLNYEDALKYGFYVEVYARKRNLDPDLVVAIIITESHANYLVESSVGAIGLMQIHYKVWKKVIDLSKKELFEPKTNIRYGTKILKYYLDRYDGNVVDAVRAYNTGSRKKLNPNYTTKVLNTYFNIKTEK